MDHTTQYVEAMQRIRTHAKAELKAVRKSRAKFGPQQGTIDALDALVEWAECEIQAKE